MEVITTHTKVYGFEELSDTAKETAREWWREGAFEHDWYDVVYEDAKEIGKLFGLDIEDISFSGFSCQGDGASLTGFYEYKKGSVAAVKDYAPKDDELNGIVERLADFQKKYFYTVQATIKRGHLSNHYSHSNTADVDGADQHGDLQHEENTVLQRILRDFMDWIYRQLETEWDFQNSNESVDDNITGNDYQFTENGRVYV